MGWWEDYLRWRTQTHESNPRTATPAATATATAPVTPEPTTPDVAAATTVLPERRQDQLPFPEPRDEYERFRNQEQAIAWEIEDLQKLMGALDPDQTGMRDRYQDNIRDARTRLTAQQGVVARAKADRDAAAAKGPKTIQKQEQHPNGGTYIVTYTVDAQGNETWDGKPPVELFPPSAQKGVDLQTAQVNLQRAQQQLAEATSPEARQKLQLEVEQARLALQTAQLGLEQTRERAPVDLATAQTNLAIAQQRLAEATSPEAQETARLKVEQARFELEQARLGAPLERETAQLGLERGRVDLETARLNQERARALQDPVAEYQRQVQASQQKAMAYRDDLNGKVLRGELSTEDASKQFDQWWGANVAQPLTPYQTMAEAAYRRESNEYEARQAAERARVEQLNRAREQLAYGAGETARGDLNALAPQARSPEFLAQLAQNVSRIGQPLPGGPSQHSGGMQFSPESLSLANVRRAMPNLTEVGNQAVARALSRISPAAAQQIGAPPPRPPGLPEFADYMRTAPFSIPNPALPVPGREALDLGNPTNAGLLGLPVQPGYAGTQYQGGRVDEPWRIPQG